MARDKKTGTFFITTDDNHAARFVMENGAVTSIGYRQLHGYDALPKIQQIHGGSCRFVEGGFISMEEVPLPSTGELLGMLKEGDRLQSTAPIATGALADALIALRREYARYLGPMARVICEEYIEDNGAPKDQGEFAQMVQELAEEIDVAGKREAFKRKVSELV